MSISFQSKYNIECNIGCLTFVGSTFDHLSAELGFSGRKKSSSHYDDQCFLDSYRYSCCCCNYMVDFAR